MFYHCSSDKCNKIFEYANTPPLCPYCKHQLQSIDESELSGDDWCSLGVYWHDQEEDHAPKVIAYFRRAAALGSGWGVSNLAWCTEDGIGVARDMRQAFWLYKQAVELDYTPALCSLGVCYEQGNGVKKDPEKAVEYYTNSANRGLVRGQILLARCYTEGIGVEKDLKKAIGWRRIAAMQGDAQAQYSLAHCYEYGLGCTMNPELAVKWYYKAASRGYHEAQFALGECCRKGQWLEQDFSAAVAWYTKATINKHPESTRALALAHLKGEGIPQDLTYGFKLLFLAVQRGEARALEEIGVCYLNGVATELSEEKAFTWWEMGAKLDVASCQIHTATCYEEGIGVGRDITTAIDWFCKAAEQGSLDGLNHLFRCLVQQSAEPEDLYALCQEKIKELYANHQIENTVNVEDDETYQSVLSILKQNYI